MNPGENQTILVVDDNPFNREGLGMYLENAGYSTCHAGDEQEAFMVAEIVRPAGAIVDIVIPASANTVADMDANVGLNLVARLKQLNPSMGIVVFSAYDDRGREVMNMVRDGGRGLAYILKGNRPERVLQALELSLAGNVVLDPDALTNTRKLSDEIRQRLTPEERPWVERAAARFPALSDREREVAIRLANSQNLNGIAGSLGISPHTVENHITNLYNTLELSLVDSRAPTLRKSTLLAKACMLHELSLIKA